MRLVVFLHGTAIMHPGALGRSREARVAQVRAGTDPSLHDYAAYVPVGDAAAKLCCWQRQGAQIDYLSSHRNLDDIAADQQVLRKHGFPSGRALARQPGQRYGDLVAVELPDVLIEDDCESIGATRSPTSRSAPTSVAASSRSSSPSLAASTISQTACRTC